MGREVDLLANYPRSKRNVDERGATKSEADRAVARRFGREFFDGDRSLLYVRTDFGKRYGSAPNSAVHVIEDDVAGAVVYLRRFGHLAVLEVVY